VPVVNGLVTVGHPLAAMAGQSTRRLRPDRTRGRLKRRSIDSTKAASRCLTHATAADAEISTIADDTWGASRRPSGGAASATCSLQARLDAGHRAKGNMR
jgi:hypothetical protein